VLARTKGYISGQRVRKNKLGRPQGGFSKSARKLPVLGRSFEARRKIIARATKIAGISPAAKDAAKAVGLDDNQKALLKIAKASGRKAQIRKATKLGDQLRETSKMRATSRDNDGNDQKRELDGAGESPPLQPGSDSKAKVSADTEDSDDENARKVPKDTTLEELEALWRQAGGPKLWKFTPVAVRNDFTDMLLRARCSAKVDVAAFVRDVFCGRTEIYIRELNCFAKTKGISTKVLNFYLRSSGYRRKKRGPGAGAPWVRLNNDRDWKGRAKVITDDELEAPFVAESKLQAETERKVARDPPDYDYYNI
jgi:hypothetical protein